MTVSEQVDPVAAPPVAFDQEAAVWLAARLRLTAGMLDDQARWRPTRAVAAQQDWRGAYADRFAARLASFGRGSAALADALCTAAAHVDTCAEAAAREQLRRDAVRAWVAAEDDRDPADTVHAFLLAQRRPSSVGIPPPAGGVAVPALVVDDGAPGPPTGVSSARPDELSAYAAVTRSADEELAAAGVVLRRAGAEFVERCAWARFDPDPLLAALCGWFAVTAETADLVARVAEAFRRAGDGDVGTLSDLAIERSVRAGPVRTPVDVGSIAVSGPAVRPPERDDTEADDWEYAVAAAMVIGGAALMFTGVGGFAGLALMAASGGLLSAGGSVAVQKARDGRVDWGRAAEDAALGAAGGAVGGVAAGAVAKFGPMVARPVLRNVVAGAAGDVTQGGITRDATGGDPLDPRAVVTDAVVGGGAGLVGGRLGAHRRTGIGADAPFAQRTHGETFSPAGLHAGRTIDEVAAALRAGTLRPKDVPIDAVHRGGYDIIVNTRSSQALTRAEIPRADWAIRDRTGEQETEDRLSAQLERNRLDAAGTPSVRSTGRR